MSPGGQLVTLYSFKGGVGRTMAAANVAYHAASNGLRVLLMDWDLEAPGLPYYFRGHLDPQEVASLITKPGVLDLVWEWTASARGATSRAEVDALVARFAEPETFRQSTTTLISSRRLRSEGQIDLISAGALTRVDRSPAAYEEALAAFSWSEFFNEAAGGVFIRNLRAWAKSEYDLILVDSRTGFADVAGVCTMQMPDTVLLCFVLNRQNVEGIAKVAASIRALRGDEIKLRLVPMRISSGQPGFEEADARGWASRELRNTGGLDPARIEGDMDQLAIRLSDSVPFYESLSAFYPPDPTVDPLTLNYLALTKALTDRNLQVQPIDPKWREAVRRRLVSNRVTVAYLHELRTAEPSRALEELAPLVQTALQENAEFDEEYISALVETIFHVWEESDLDQEPLDLLEAAQKLLRQLASQDPDRWRIVAADGLQRYEENIRWRSGVDVAAETYEEIDALLAGANQTAEILLRRAELRRRLGRLRLQLGEVLEAVAQAAVSIQQAQEAAGLSTADDAPTAVLAIADGKLLLGDAQAKNGSLDVAIKEYEDVVAMLNELDRVPQEQMARVSINAHAQLAQWLLDRRPDEAAEHAILAIQPGRTRSFYLVRLPQLAAAVLASSAAADNVGRLLQALDNDTTTRPGFLTMGLTRSPELATAFIRSVLQLIDAAPDAARVHAKLLLVDCIRIAKRLTDGTTTAARSLNDAAALLHSASEAAAATGFPDVAADALKVAQMIEHRGADKDPNANG